MANIAVESREDNAERVKRLVFEEVAQLTLAERRRYGHSAYEEINVAICYDRRNDPDEQPDWPGARPLVGQDLLNCLTDPPMG